MSLPQTPEALRAAGYTQIKPDVWAKLPFLPSVDGEPDRIVGAVDVERDLHDAILTWAFIQWPRWKIVYARTDKKSTLPLGCHDMTAFGPDKKMFCIELKSKTGKQDKDQRDWAHEMAMLGHTVWVIRSLQQFTDLVLNDKPPR